MSEHSVAAVKPAIRPPRESVEGLMRILVSPTVQKDLRRTGRFRLVPILNWDEHQVRRGANPYTAEADFKAAHKVQPFHEHCPFVEFAVTVSVFKNQDAILPLAFRRANRVSVSLGNPKPATIVDGKSDRLFYVRFTSEERGFEARRQGHFFGGIFR